MALILDDVLKVYVLNRDLFNNATTVEEFAKLYDEMKEFEVIEERYNKINLLTVKQLLEYAAGHLEEFITPFPPKGETMH